MAALYSYDLRQKAIEAVKRSVIDESQNGLLQRNRTYLENFGSTISGQLSKLRRTQSIPTSLLSLIF